MELFDKSIIISDLAYQKKLFLYRNNYASKDIKIYSKNDIIDKLSFIYVNDSINYLINNMNIEYSKAKKYVSLLRVADLSNSNTLKKMYDELFNNGYIKENDLANIEFKGYKIYLFEMNEDIEIKNLLNRFNLEYQEINFSDLGIEKKTDINNIDILYFKTKYYQFNYLFSSIRKEIITNKDNKERINILINDEFDIYYLNMFSNIYKIDYRALIKRRLITNKDVKKYLVNTYNIKEIKPYNGDIPECLLINEYILKYGLDKLDFTYGYLNLVEILSSYSIKEYTNDKGIKIMTDFNINDNLNYVTNFTSDSFYKEYKDDSVLSDNELKAIGVNTSYIKTMLDRRLKLNYLEYNDIKLLSRCELHLSDSIFDSQFVEELKIKKENLKKVYNNDDGYYTTESIKLVETDFYDRAFYKKPIKEKNIRTYDHKFKGINPSYIDNKKWYITDLESFIGCPYKYYLSKIIPPIDDDIYNRALGSLIHTVFENVYHEGYDFYTEFNRGKEIFKKMYTEKDIPYQIKYDAFLEMIEFWLSRIVDTYREIMTINNINLAKTEVDANIKDSEIKVTYKIGEYELSGKIDKVIWTKYMDNNYYYIIDYKSGKEDFNLYEAFLGKSIQLPLYYYAVEHYNQNIKSNAKFMGFGIQHTYDSNLKTIFNPKERKKMGKFTGLIDNEEGFNTSLGQKPDLYFKIDDSFNNNRIKFHKKEYNYSLDDLIEDCKNSVINTIDSIKNSKFDISPTSSNLNGNDTDMVCKYCTYKDVCYKKKSDYKSYKNTISNKFSALQTKIGGDDNE